MTLDSNCMVFDWVGRWVGMTNAASARWNPSPRTLALSTVGWDCTTGGCNYSGWVGGCMTVTAWCVIGWAGGWE